MGSTRKTVFLFPWNKFGWPSPIQTWRPPTCSSHFDRASVAAQKPIFYQPKYPPAGSRPVSSTLKPVESGKGGNPLKMRRRRQTARGREGQPVERSEAASARPSTVWLKNPLWSAMLSLFCPLRGVRSCALHADHWQLELLARSTFLPPPIKTSIAPLPLFSRRNCPEIKCDTVAHFKGTL